MKSNYKRLFYKVAFSINNNHYKVIPLPTSDWALAEVHHISKHGWVKKKQILKKFAKHYQLNVVLFIVIEMYGKKEGTVSWLLAL